MKTNTILQGDSLTKLKELPDKSINMVMTSPPYWALRDYGVDGQLGLEPTFGEYINKLCDIFDEVKRVLRDDGTCWVNIGDTYSTSPVGNFNGGGKEFIGRNMSGVETSGKIDKSKSGLPSKCLTMIPMRFAIEMVNRGWILRNTIIWHKPNCMPSSVKDRFTVDFEYLFFFSKKKKYYFETQYEPISESYAHDKRPHGIIRQKFYENSSYNKSDDPHLNQFKHKNLQEKGQPVNSMHKNRIKGKEEYKKNTQGRNKRTVWRICPKPFKEAHFAVYPEELCETPIKAGCPEFVCKKCGNPKVIDLEHNKISEVGKDYLETKKTPYSVQERKGFVKVRKLPNIKEFAKYINDRRKLQGVTIDEIESRHKSQAPHHWFNAESFPPVEDYKWLKEVLTFGDKYDEQLTKEYFKPAEKQSLDYSNKGYKPTCNCNAGFTGGIVLDPFFGAGTTGLVALKQGKKFIGIELNPEYIEIAKKRLRPFIEQQTLPCANGVSENDRVSSQTNEEKSK